MLEKWSSGVVQRCCTAKRNGLNGAQSWPGNPLSPPNGEPRTHLVLSEKVGVGKGIGSRARDEFGRSPGGIASSRSAVFEVHDRPDPASGYVQNYRPVRGARGRAPSHLWTPNRASQLRVKLGGRESRRRNLRNWLPCARLRPSKSPGNALLADKSRLSSRRQ